MLEDEKGSYIWSYQCRGKDFVEIIQQINVIVFVDENLKLWDSYIEDISLYAPAELLVLEYDFLYLGMLTYFLEVMKRLREMEISDGEIINRYVSIPTYARIEFLNRQKPC